MTPKFAPISKVNAAIGVVDYLNAHGLTMTYGELAAIVQHPRQHLGQILDAVNVHHKEQGGTDMVTTCVVNKTGVPGPGYDLCAQNHGLTPGASRG